MVDWSKTSPLELEVINKIVNRALKTLRLRQLTPLCMTMDLIAVDQDCGLAFSGLLAADDFDFVHDIYGIDKNMNRTTGKLENEFVPRFALRGNRS